MKIGVIDYGSGNFSSVWNAVNSVTTHAKVVRSEVDFEDCSHLILPGVGTFYSAMENISKMRILESLQRNVLMQKKQFLGICVGMQILGSYGTEFLESKGLSWLPGGVIKLTQTDLPLPHIGWNEINDSENSPLFVDIEKEATFYFVHSYHLAISDPMIKTVKSYYGQQFVAAVSSENIHGVQFHPEKSQLYGLKLLSNFISLK